MPGTRAAGTPAEAGSRVVVRLGNRLVKGFLDPASLREIGPALPSVDLLLESGAIESVPLAEAKAIFFVKTFAGRNEREDLRFHDHLPSARSLWVRLTFADNEVMEGLVENGARYVLDAGFLVTPTDPTANNWLMYVPKTQIKRFEVLGLRQRLVTQLT